MQAAQQGYRHQGTAQGAARQQQPHHLLRQQQPHGEQHSNGTQQARPQPNLQSLLSIQAGYSAPAPDSRKRKAEDDHSALFSLLPAAQPSAPGSSASIIPQQVRPTHILAAPMLIFPEEGLKLQHSLFSQADIDHGALFSLLRISGPTALPSAAAVDT